MAITGSRSVFDLIHRDTLSNPSASLDAELLNRIADSIVRLETWMHNAVTVVPQESEAPALVFAVQRWLWYNSGTDNDAPCILTLSPAFLEDAGVIPRQQEKPSTPLVSLAQDVSLSVPAYTVVPSNYSPLVAMGIQMQPAWVAELRGVPLASFSVRMLDATGTDVFHLEAPTYFDLGDGISPRMLGHIFHSTPNKRNTPVPQTTFEICLLVLNWAQ